MSITNAVSLHPQHKLRVGAQDSSLALRMTGRSGSMTGRSGGKTGRSGGKPGRRGGKTGRSGGKTGRSGGMTRLACTCFEHELPTPAQNEGGIPELRGAALSLDNAKAIFSSVIIRDALGQ